MTIDNELIDILRIDCAGLTVQQSAFKQANHINYIYMHSINLHCINLYKQENPRFKADEYILNKPIKCLSLWTIPHNALISLGIDTVAKVLMLTKNDIINLHKVHKVSLASIGNIRTQIYYRTGMTLARVTRAEFNK